MKKCLIVIPVYNESRALPMLVNRLNELKRIDLHLNIDFIFINDGSEDESEKILTDDGMKYISLINNTLSFHSIKYI